MIAVETNSQIIRLLIFLAIIALPQIAKLMQKNKGARPAPPQARPGASPMSEAMREAIQRSQQARQASDPAAALRMQARQRDAWRSQEVRMPIEAESSVRLEADALRRSEPINLPRAIQPESSFLPKLLLLALLLCVGVAAYVYFAG